MSNHQFWLEQAKSFPYDAPDSYQEDYDTNKQPPVAKDWCHLAARGVLANLLGRRGIRPALEDLDEDIRIDIIDSVTEIIRAAHKSENQ